MTAADASTRPAPGSWRELAQVAWPLVISSGSLSLMYVVDRMFLFRYSTDALAASGPGTLLHWTLISLAFGTAVYVNTFVAQYSGAGRPDRVAAALWQGIWFSLAAGLLFVPVGAFAKELFALVGHDPAVQRYEADYFAPLCYGTTAFLLTATLACYFTGQGRTLTVMWVNVLIALINIVLDYVMVFGWGPFPEWGAYGAAVATALAQAVGAVLYVGLILREADGASVAAAWRLEPDLMRRLLKFGLPSGSHLLVDGLCFTLFVQIVGLMGPRDLAATNLAFTLNMLVFVPILGLNTAIMTLTGQRIGEGRPELAVRSTWMAFVAAEAFTVGCALVYLLAPGLVLLPYRRDTDPAEYAALSAQVIVLLRFVAVYSTFDAMTVIFGAAIRGAGDTRFAMWFSGLAGLALMVVPTWVAYRYFEGGLMAAWTAATVLIVVLGIGFFLRFQGGKWKSMRVIESAGEDLTPAPVEAELAAAPN
jgi:MATE family multidrug resistance protein